MTHKQIPTTRTAARLMTTPGVEPGLSRPQRDVLTTRRCGLLREHKQTSKHPHTLAKQKENVSRLTRDMQARRLFRDNMTWPSLFHAALPACVIQPIVGGSFLSPMKVFSHRQNFGLSGFASRQVCP